MAAPSDRRATLTDWLSEYRPADGRERGFREQMLDLAGMKGDPFAPSHFMPGHFTASAFILSPDRSAVLLIHHSKLQRWLQPGGHVAEDDLDLLATARREVSEEVGLLDVPLAQRGIFDIDVHAIPPWKGDPEHRHFDVRFLLLAPTLQVQAASDASDARWIPLGAVAGPGADESVLRALRKIN